jgi:ornithine cyclodeaminase/alanine dehydrogenase-like protein (mu-crystallin family)
MSRTVRVLREADVRSALDMAACIDACEEAFIAYSTGGAELPDVIHLNVPEAEGEIHVKAGYLHGGRYYAVKMASGFHAQEPPAIDGMVAVFDARDGAPVAFLLDNGYITDLRTGAAGGVAAEHLAPEEVRSVALIGTGGQARQQLDALGVVRPGFVDVRVWGRDPQHAAACADDLRARVGAGVTVAAAPSVQEAVRDADVVITCTAAREPLVQRAWLKPGAHVTAVGSDGVDKQELDPAVLQEADVLVVDSRDQCLRLGELQHAPGQADRAVELGAVCEGSAAGRTDASQLTVCDLTGLGVQDVAAANVVMTRAGDLGEGLEI